MQCVVADQLVRRYHEERVEKVGLYKIDRDAQGVDGFFHPELAALYQASEERCIQVDP